MTPVGDVPDKDRLFASARADVVPFRFDEQVASVFPDMIARSVPGYSDVLSGLSHLARRVVQARSNVYDLGCSLGAATLAVASGVDQDQVQIIAVDNSPAMLERATQRVASFRHRAPVILVLSDLLDVQVENASLVLLNYTMQFIPVDRRDELCQRVYRGLNPGGVLVLSEKIRFPDSDVHRLMTGLHEDFKRMQGYSELEISQKRTALEGVLVPESLDDHRQRLQRAGFATATVWFQHYNFLSILATKRD